MTVYYRVKKDNFLWKEGAVLEKRADCGTGGYKPVEDVWDSTPCNGDEYITSRIVEHENNSEWFERVYKNTIAGSLYKTADQLKQTYKDAFK